MPIPSQILTANFFFLVNSQSKESHLISRTATMKSLLFRTGSGPIPVQVSQAHGSPRLSTSVSLHAEVSRRSIRRSASEPDIIRSEMRTLSKLQGSRSFSVPRISEAVEYEGRSGDWPTTWEDLGSPGGGMNKNRNSGGGGNGGHGSDAEPNNIGGYYLDMIKSDPTNSLLLRNYGKYLHEVRY